MTSPTTEDVPRVGEKFTVLRKTAEGRSVVCVAPATSVTKRGSYYFCTIGNCEFWLSNRFGGVLHHAPRDHQNGSRFGVDVRRYAGEDDDRALADYQDRARLATALQDAKTWPHEKVLRVLAALDDTLYAAHQEALAKLRGDRVDAAFWQTRHEDLRKALGADSVLSHERLVKLVKRLLDEVADDVHNTDDSEFAEVFRDLTRPRRQRSRAGTAASE